MSTTINESFLKFVEKEVLCLVKNFCNDLEEHKAKKIAKDIVKTIDWNDSALTKKGLYGISYSYLEKKNLTKRSSEY